MWTQNLKVDGSYLRRRLIWVNLGLLETTLLVKQLTERSPPTCVWKKKQRACACDCPPPSGVRARTLTVDDGGGQDGRHGGLLRQELDAVQQPCRVHALAQRHVVHRLQPRVKVHRERHQLLALHHVFGGGAPQLATCTKQTGDLQVREGRRTEGFAVWSFTPLCNVKVAFRRLLVKQGAGQDRTWISFCFIHSAVIL